MLLDAGASPAARRLVDGRTPVEVSCSDAGIFLHRGQIGRVIPGLLASRTDSATVKRFFLEEVKHIKKSSVLSSATTISYPLDCRDLNLPLRAVSTFNTKRILRSASIIKYAKLTPEEATHLFQTCFEEIVQNMDGFLMLDALIHGGADLTGLLPSGLHPLERAVQCAVSASYLHLLAEQNAKKGIRVYSFVESASTKGTLAHACIRAFKPKDEESTGAGPAAIIKSLLLSGVDVNAKDSEGDTIKALAERKGAVDVVEVIDEFSKTWKSHYNAGNQTSAVGRGDSPRERVKVRVAKKTQPTTPAPELDLNKFLQQMQDN